MLLAIASLLAEDAAAEGKKVITGMLIVGLVFVAVIALGRDVEGAQPSAQGAQASSVLNVVAPPADLRAWIALLEREGELVRISAEVDPDLEITEINDRIVKAGGPALLFENVKGSSHPLLINQFGTERRMCLAFDAPSLDDVARRLGDVLEMQPPEGLVAKVKGLQKLKSIADSRPKTVRSGASQEIVLTGESVDLDALPIQRCWPGDPAPFITLPAVITHDPRNGNRNVGMYRMQKVDKRTTLMHWQIHKDGRADYLLASGRLEVAVALGLDPVSAYSASAPLPKHIDEFMLAGFLKGSPVELVPGEDDRTSRCRRTRRSSSRATWSAATSRSKGPFGDHTGYYTAARAVPRLPRHRASRCGATRSIRRSSSASRRRRTPGSARRPSGSSCRRSG